MHSGDATLLLQIDTTTDASWYSHQCLWWARQLGASDETAWAVAIAASELVTNAQRYAGAGTLSLRPLPAPARGAELLVEDEGPGIADLPLAISDSHSQGKNVDQAEPPWPRPSLGNGLGAVARLMDRVHFSNRSPKGLRVLATKRW